MFINFKIENKNNLNHQGKLYCFIDKINSFNVKIIKFYLNSIERFAITSDR